jgi:hypothetical protein
LITHHNWLANHGIKGNEMTYQVINNSLVIKNDLVHVEFDRNKMKTFVWLPNHSDLAYNEEFMKKFFESDTEYAVQVDFDLFEDMVVPLIQGLEQKSFGCRLVSREDEHIFVAMKNKLQKCIDEINSLKYIDETKIEAVSLVEKVDDIRNLSVRDTHKLSQRIKNALLCGDIFTLGDLEKITEYQLIAINNLGKTSRKEIKEYMQANGLKLKSH